MNKAGGGVHYFAFFLLFSLAPIFALAFTCLPFITNFAHVTVYSKKNKKLEISIFLYFTERAVNSIGDKISKDRAEEEEEVVKERKGYSFSGERVSKIF